MYINTFKYTPKDVSCQLCTEYVKKLGCTALRCPWLAERIEAGVVGYREAVMETFPRDLRLSSRLNLLIKHYPGSLWSNEQHERRMQYQCAVQGYRRRRDTNAYYAAMPRRRHPRNAEKSKFANTPPSLRGISFLTGKSGVTKVIGGITMSRVTELEKALTTLFRKGTEVGYTETEIDEFLENIDYHALLQAVWNKAETVYAYRADGKNALSLDYRSAELFKQRATLLYEDVGDSYIGAVFAARSMELWLLEDMGFAVVAKFSVNAGEGEYVTEYRVYKGSDWADSEISLDLEDLVAELAALCDPYYEHEQPIYEL